MIHLRNPGAMRQTFVGSSRAVGVVMMAAMAGLSLLTPAVADPPKPGPSFAHKYNAYIDTRPKADVALMLRAPSFQALVETRADGLIGCTRPELIGGIHQAKKAVTMGAAAGQPVRFDPKKRGQEPFLTIGLELKTVSGRFQGMARFVRTGHCTDVDFPAASMGQRLA